MSAPHPDGLPTAQLDMVAHPSHYTAGPECPSCGTVIECITIAERFPFSLGAVIKYLWRHERKGAPIQDLRKARQYLDFEIARRERAERRVP